MTFLSQISPSTSIRLIGILITFASSPSMAQLFPVEFQGGITAIAQQTDEDRIDGNITASADLFITSPTSSGSWLIYIEGNTSPTSNGVASRLIESNADAGTALDEDRSGRVQISEFNYTFDKENYDLTVGLIDASGYLDRSRITNDENVQFLGAGFVNNPAIEFPDYSLGFAYQRAAGDSMPELNLVVSSSHGLADNPNLSYPQLLSLSDADKGVFIGAGAGVRKENVLFRVGAWANTSAHNTLLNDDSDADNYGIYSVLGYSSGEHGINLRLGFANSDVSQASAFMSVAYRLRLGNNAFGVGFSQTTLAQDARAPGRDDSSQFEMFYRFAISDNIHLTPSVQYLVNSGFDSSESDFDSRIALVGLRFHLAF